MSAMARAPSSSGAVTDPIRVMVVDDSVVIRGLLGRWLDEDPNLAVVASHRNGRLAVDDVLRSNPDVVILDIEMPDMDGLTALPLLIEKKRNLVVVVASTLTRRNAEISLKALSLGAADYVPKPESNSGVTTSTEFRRELIEKVTHLGQRARKRGLPGQAPAGRPMPRPQPGAPAPAAHSALRASRPGSFTIRAYSSVRPRILTIGSSTGGPQALNALFGEIGSAIGMVPVVLTQHMPPTFTAILAEHITKAAGRPASEGRDGEAIQPGHIYVAPGGKHMLLAKNGGDVVIRLSDAPPVNFCKPAVDPLFKSVAEIYGTATLAVVLTGMGSDGAEGVRRIGEIGGSAIAQDEETSVVWGMPGAAAHTGMCSDVLPLNEIGRKVSKILLGGRP
ncbi:Chemotaxis response regulator protein-glutamate methylesterase of group 2 operon [uncultured Pleomorphomonas sp.]|uniref:Protein-glutamate methylesterase/protein-glutamine glutaminase n=2 Tax=Pleomorphomonas TaxID=261933 RepID=A0A2G9WQT9_9HYPH|nr:chemotaxis response regulator protein-glutamate methylesterase [Pleomorphomonas carboxyditropha]PIO97089.1 chemotaxis response regulator protein-glutamate methylesterase [Pleomorphomonas carboxyditropha]SCM79003.1 Chemotaxis response regulator protein-glutamate methylesterase of group 2 operon [uncultured Pleomorphomonas sp.]